MLANSAVLAALVAVSGWAVTHWFTLRAQRRNFLDQVIDRARVEVARTTREYQDWLSKFKVTLMLLESPFIAERLNLPPDWKRQLDIMMTLMSERQVGVAWSIALEEHEILFSETREVRAQLLLRQNEILQFLSEVIRDLQNFVYFPGPRESREARVKQLQLGVPLLWDQEMLIEDLRIHVQNVALSRVVGGRVPERQPTDPNVPRIIAGSKGQLVIERHGSVPAPPGLSVRAD